ncbi:MAG TPA: DNA repair protein RadA [Acidimicrobiales bacterium]
MPRQRTVFRCTDCGAEAPRWAGRCGTCGEWNTLIEEISTPVAAPTGSSATAPVALTDVPGQGATPAPTGISELDRVLGGGLVPGSVTLLGGEPGIGKSTLLLQALADMARAGRRCLLVSAEESPAQVRRRAERLSALIPGVWLVGETSLGGIRAAIAEVSPDVVVVDSIQTVWDAEIDSSPGSIAQVRGCAQVLVTLAKSGGPAIVLVGHVTKEGALAGPRVLEHMVDTVLSFDGDRHHALRLLRAVKHRFGSTGELGLFEMTASGLEGVEDAGGLFLADRRSNVPGSVVFPVMEGQRPLLVEIQALEMKTTLPTPRRSASGYDASRLSLLLAVLEKRAGVRLSNRDVYVSVAGGVRVGDPGADLAVCIALASAVTARPVGSGLVVIGEVGLGGEVRQVAHAARRLAEAARLGFETAVVPPSTPKSPGISTLHVTSLVDAIERSLGEQAARPELRLVGSAGD